MTMEIAYATTNKGKFISLERALQDTKFKVVQNALDIPEPRSSDVREIAEAKLTYAYQQIKAPVVVLDAGFYIHSRNGFPRAFVNFALETIDIAGILDLVKGRERTCDFRECLGFTDGQQSVYFIGQVHGTIANEPRGVMQPHLWSRLGLIFVQEGSTKTHAEMTPEEYKARKSTGISSGRQFADWLQNYHSSEMVRKE